VFKDQTLLFENTLADLGQVGFSWRIADGKLEWHGNAAVVLGVSQTDIPGTAHDLKLLINPQDLPNFMTALQDHAHHLGTAGEDRTIRVSEPFRIRMRDGTQRAMRLEGRIACEEETGAAVLSGIMMYDPATAYAASVNVLSTRNAISSAIEHILLSRSSAVRNRGYFMALGLDRVGLLNAAHGASFVDTVLVEVEHRLGAFLAGKAAVGRMSGDVYGLIFEDLPHSQADALAAALLQLFTSTPVLTLHGPVVIGLSIGGAALITTDEKGSDVVARAEAALAQGKKKGRGCFIVSSPLTEEREVARKLLAGGHAVYKALEEGRMRMAFQPVMDMDSKNTIFYESLIRMVDSNGRLVRADEFVPALERLGMMRLLDIYALHSAVKELSEFPNISLSVNVSPMSLVDAGWLRAAVSLMSNRPAVAKRLIVEITESSAMDDLQSAVRVLNTLKELGCRIALDDFGAGQTSFSQIKKLSVDIVKIDKHYIRNISDPVNQIFVKSLLELAERLGLQTVAEGAETMEEAEFLRDEGIRNIQGYAFGFPSIERVWLPKTHELRTTTPKTASNV
jgi:EAL domain-containing protein (putative c-di-GMP-specific phosphodiesterase class I)/GGDEF domain-containing protein